MILPNAKVEITTGGYGVQGFTFKALGDIPPGQTEYAERSQGQNPIFTADQAGNPFQSGVTYMFTAEHPTYVPDPELVRVVFDENGGYKVLSPGEDSGSGGNGGNGGSNAVPNLQQVTNVGAVTTKGITTGGYSRPKANPVISMLGVTVWQENGLLESAEKMTLETFRTFLNGTAQANYNLGLTVNTCTTVGGYLFNPVLPSVPAKAKLYIDDTYMGDITATSANADVAAQFGVPATSLIIFSYAIPAAYQDNYVHTVKVRHIETGAELGKIYTPGTCGIQTAPKPTFNIIAYYEEIPAQAEVNLPPTVVDPVKDTPLTGIGDFSIIFPDDEFSDTDTLTYRGFGWNGSVEIPLPSGVVYDATWNNGKGRIYVGPNVPSGASFVVRREAKDTAGQPAAYIFLVTVNRTTTPTQPTDYVVRRIIDGSTQVYEVGGTGGQWSVTEWLGSGLNRTFTGTGKPRWRTPYPNYAAITEYNPAGGVYTWRSAIQPNTIEKDVTLFMEFEMPDGTVLVKEVLAINMDSTANRPPVLNVPRRWNAVPGGVLFTLPFSSGPVGGPPNQWSDPDGDPLSFKLQISNDGGFNYTDVLPSWLHFNATDFYGTPPNQPGGLTLNLRTICSDGKGGTAKDDFNLLIGYTPAP